MPLPNSHTPPPSVSAAPLSALTGNDDRPPATPPNSRRTNPATAHPHGKEPHPSPPPDPPTIPPPIPTHDNTSRPNPNARTGAVPTTGADATGAGTAAGTTSTSGAPSTTPASPTAATDTPRVGPTHLAPPDNLDAPGDFDPEPSPDRTPEASCPTDVGNPERTELLPFTTASGTPTTRPPDTDRALDAGVPVDEFLGESDDPALPAAPAVPTESANALTGNAATATPIPNATANAPTRPTPRPTDLPSPAMPRPPSEKITAPPATTCPLNRQDLCNLGPHAASGRLIRANSAFRLFQVSNQCGRLLHLVQRSVSTTPIGLPSVVLLPEQRHRDSVLLPARAHPLRDRRQFADCLHCLQFPGNGYLTPP